jgi:hypothetical protein
MINALPKQPPPTKARKPLQNRDLQQNNNPLSPYTKKAPYLFDTGLKGSPNRTLLGIFSVFRAQNKPFTGKSLADFI